MLFVIRFGLWLGLARLARQGRLGSWRGGLSRRLGRLLKQVSDRRHLLAHDYLQLLEHLRPGVQLIGVKILVLGRFLYQILAHVDQGVELSRVRQFRGRLLLDLLAHGRIVQGLGRQVAQLLVGLVQLQFPVIHLLGCARPLAHLLGQPLEVLCRREHVEHKIRGIDPLTLGQIVLGKGT